jgi:hypothetical protein
VRFDLRELLISEPEAVPIHHALLRSVNHETAKPPIGLWVRALGHDSGDILDLGKLIEDLKQRRDDIGRTGADDLPDCARSKSSAVERVLLGVEAHMTSCAIEFYEGSGPITRVGEYDGLTQAIAALRRGQFLRRAERVPFGPKVVFQIVLTGQVPSLLLAVPATTLEDAAATRWTAVDRVSEGGARCPL